MDGQSIADAVFCECVFVCVCAGVFVQLCVCASCGWVGVCVLWVCGSVCLVGG